MVNTPAGEKAQADDHEIRRAAVQYGIPYTTTIDGAAAAASAIASLKNDGVIRVRCLQEFHRQEAQSAV